MAFIDFALWFLWLCSTLGSFAAGFQLGKLMRPKAPTSK